MFSKYGTLRWEDLEKMCGGDIKKKLMALEFSHAFPLKRPVPLAEIWDVFDRNGVGRSVQSPRRLPPKAFKELFRRGYPEGL